MPGKTSSKTPRRQDAKSKAAGTRRAAHTPGATLRVKQVRSGIGRPAVHRRTLQALGLRHHQDVVEVTATPAIQGMLFQVRHLVEVTPAGEK